MDRRKKESIQLKYEEMVGNQEEQKTELIYILCVIQQGSYTNNNNKSYNLLSVINIVSCLNLATVIT